MIKQKLAAGDQSPEKIFDDLGLGRIAGRGDRFDEAESFGGGRISRQARQVDFVDQALVGHPRGAQPDQSREPISRSVKLFVKR